MKKYFMIIPIMIGMMIGSIPPLVCGTENNDPLILADGHRSDRSESREERRRERDGDGRNRESRRDRNDHDRHDRRDRDRNDEWKYFVAPLMDNIFGRDHRYDRRYRDYPHHYDYPDRVSPRRYRDYDYPRRRFDGPRRFDGRLDKPKNAWAHIYTHRRNGSTVYCDRRQPRHRDFIYHGTAKVPRHLIRTCFFR